LTKQICCTCLYNSHGHVVPLSEDHMPLSRKFYALKPDIVKEKLYSYIESSCDCVCGSPPENYAMVAFDCCQKRLRLRCFDKKIGNSLKCGYCQVEYQKSHILVNGEVKHTETMPLMKSRCATKKASAMIMELKQRLIGQRKQLMERIRVRTMTTLSNLQCHDLTCRF
jgi:hypothetical protein